VISTSTLVNSVVEKLRAALVRGQWRRGEMLPGQRELAEQMGISRPSLREAVIVLETLGLVRSMPGKGVVVLEPRISERQSSDAVTDASLEDILQLRYTLEPFIVGLVAQSISSKEVGQLRLTLMDMREALDEGNAEAGMNAYIGFHEELFALTSNPIFQKVVQ
jgi:GntR family transcriptional repressor for pyruvate dehydrogenase complex